MNEDDAKVEPLHLHLTKRAEIAGASRGNPVAVGYIYVIQAEGMQIFKIGQTPCFTDPSCKALRTSDARTANRLRLIKGSQSSGHRQVGFHLP